jgi:hypothetical protein
MANFSAYVELGALIIQLIFLAIALSAVGLGVRNIINRVSESRQQTRLNQEAMMARAKARAKAYRQSVAS